MLRVDKENYIKLVLSLWMANTTSVVLLPIKQATGV